MKLTAMNRPSTGSSGSSLGIGLAALALAGGVTAPLLYIVWPVAAMRLVTGIVGFCPLYALLRVGTKRAAR